MSPVLLSIEIGASINTHVSSYLRIAKSPPSLDPVSFPSTRRAHLGRLSVRKLIILGTLLSASSIRRFAEAAESSTTSPVKVVQAFKAYPLKSWSQVLVPERLAKVTVSVVSSQRLALVGRTWSPVFVQLTLLQVIVPLVEKLPKSSIEAQDT